ncbi:PAS domain S-box-containing protein [Palleronia aestuarii]|uniref:PAS domain S-box-containing protein n=1 Tax=Palleronia aestuarii TaxID=568105 RepID=A0A2W7N2F1_9RHOB|nr:PAS domain S-box protein [Palleronia aestuarii]PZX14201.1 PAS domain S-box-containing protein [Palleronia aestuarii]
MAKTKAPRAARDHGQLQQLISGLGEGIVLVDLDETILWANEAALAMHGVEALTDLGKDMSEYRERFRLTYRNNHPIKEGTFPVEKVIAGEASGEITVEVSPADAPETEWTQTIRCFVITDKENVPDYLVLVLRDETARFEAEGRFESAFNANPAPAIICRLADLCFVRVNRGFLELTGCRNEDLVGQSIYAFDILADRGDRETALNCLREGRTIPQREATLTLPDGRRKSVIVAGQPIEVSDEPCMLFTFVDLDPRNRAERASRHSEERFSKAFDLSPVALAICNFDRLDFLNVNAAFARLTGYAEEQVIARNPRDLKLWAEADTQKTMLDALKADGNIVGLDVGLSTADGAPVDCLIAADTITLNDQSCVLLVIQDIGEQKRTEAELVAAIEAVMADTSWFSRGIVEKLGTLRQTSRRNIPSAETASLTNRERDVLDLVCEGQSDAEMAATLCLSPHTIRNHLTSLYRKIGVKRRAAAIAWARDCGIVHGKRTPKASGGKKG